MTTYDYISALLQALGLWLTIYLMLAGGWHIKQFYFYKTYQYDIHIPVHGSEEGIRIDGTYKVRDTNDAISWCHRMIKSLKEVDRPTGIRVQVDIERPYEVVQVDNNFKFVQDGCTFLICYPIKAKK